jgi:hypothetical protein
MNQLKIEDKKLNLTIVDGLYSEYGHYKWDILELARLGFIKIKYCIPRGKSSGEAQKEMEEQGIEIFISSKIPLLFYIKVLFNNKKKSRLIISSGSILYLVISSLLTFNFKYYYIAHFFPKTRPWINWILFKIIDEFSMGIYTYAPHVSNQLRDLQLRNVRGELISREIEFKSVEKKREAKIKKKKIIALVGVLNNYKRIDRLTNILKKECFENLEFHFHIPGINESQLISELMKTNKIHINSQKLSDDMYFKIIEKSNYIFLDYSTEYGSRCSGQVLDAISGGAIPIYNNQETFLFYKNRYDIGLMFHDVHSLMKILSEINSGENSNVTCANLHFYDVHSRINKIDKIKSIFWD